MSKKLKVLFLPLPGVGHINACVSLAQELIRANHHVIFAVEQSWIGSLQKYGIEEVLVNSDINLITGEKSVKSEQGDNPVKQLSENLVKSGHLSDLSPLEKFKKKKDSFHKRIDFYIKLDEVVEQLLRDITPDVILCDQFFTIPSVVTSGIPWVYCWSGGPLYLYHVNDDMPPGASGLSINGDKNEWKSFKTVVKEVTSEVCKRYNEYVISRGAPPLREYSFCDGSPYLNIYGFPKELDYSDHMPLPNNYYRFDNLMRSEVNEQTFEIPDQLRGKPGKLVFFSMGSMGGADVQMMKRLVAILAKSPHRFIVSKGPLHDQYELSDNMWGQQSVPQLQVLSSVDLVITHGGNNTVCETFFFGKPMIVMPLFGDQPDNAQIIQDKGFGLRLDCHHCSEDELLKGIESLLNDKQLNEKLKTISKRIQTEKSITKITSLIENIVK